MTRRDMRQLRLQYLLGRCAIFLTAPLLTLIIRGMGYRIRNLNTFRRRIDDLFRTHSGPWIICANHLTMVDSFLLAYAMFPWHRFMARYSLVPWNVPEKRNFNRNILLTCICYLLKCVPIVRGGDRKSIHMFFDKCAYILQKKESLMIFPEGTRSRTGRIVPENVSYGVGRLLNIHPDARILCLYLRGDRQQTYGVIPKLKESFHLDADTVKINIQPRGLKGQRECARKIIAQLHTMETAYFETCRQ